MSDAKIRPSGQAGLSKDAPASSWRNKLLGVGVACMFVALFVGAAAKEAAGVVPRLLLLAGLLMLAISTVAGIIQSLASKLNRGKGTSIESPS
jgi:hypothetical protein